MGTKDFYSMTNDEKLETYRDELIHLRACVEKYREDAKDWESAARSKSESMEWLKEENEGLKADLDRWKKEDVSGTFLVWLVAVWIAIALIASFVVVKERERLELADYVKAWESERGKIESPFSRKEGK
jgi:hypothetical protein